MTKMFVKLKDLIVGTEQAKSNSEAKRLISQGAVALAEGEGSPLIQDANPESIIEVKSGLIIRVGKYPYKGRKQFSKIKLDD